MSPQSNESERQESEDVSSSSHCTRQTRVLTLNDEEHHDSILYRLEKGWVLQFRLGASLLGRRVTIYVNHPASTSQDPKEFDRHTYHILQWKTDNHATDATPNTSDGVMSSATDGTAIYAEILLSQAGSFHYYFTHDGSKDLSSNGSGFFLVDPVLRVGVEGQEEQLALDCIQCQTVLSKCLGPFSSWEAKLKVSAESGYNMVHFTPIQKLGGSNSAYSLSDQLGLNPVFSTPEKKVSFDDIEALVVKMKEEWKVLSVCDIVLNHSANESAWLRQHPECTYNLCNSPHLRSAYLLDALLAKLGAEIAAGDWASSGVPPNIHTEEHLAALRTVLHGFCLPKVRIPELRMINVPALVAEFSKLASERVAPAPIESTPGKPEQLKIIQDPKFQRLQSTVDMEQALLLFNVYRSDCFDEESRLRRCTAAFRARLEELNRCAWDEGMSHISSAVENVIAHVRYHFVSGDGPRQACVSEKTPLVPRYFKELPMDPSVITTMQDEERLMYSAQASQIMAHNGWVMNDDPLRNFAAPDSDVYLRRELIAWGDSVKLRYGDKPEDCPYLWQHMREYVEQTARIFHGVRLDNCHSTPIPVAEYLLDAARRIRPDLYVVAELFTNSDQKDNIFVNRLGITSLIREAMSAWDPHELGRLVYRYGGEPVGAFSLSMTRPLMPAIAHALFLDVTHDNPSPVEMRSPYDLLPSAALVASASCASGSNRGYDEIVPHHIHVVNEARQYSEWFDGVQITSSQFVNIHSGIIVAKRALNKLHFELGKSGFNQVYVDQVDPDVVAVTRHCPRTHRSVVLIAHSAFSKDATCMRDASRLAPLRVEGTVDRVILEAAVVHKSSKSGGSRFQHYEAFKKDPSWIGGLCDYEVDIQEDIPLRESKFLKEREGVREGGMTTVDFTQHFQPGSVVAIRVSLYQKVQDSLAKLSSLMNVSGEGAKVLTAVVSRMKLVDLNRALYHCDQEERDEGWGGGAYDIPNFGPMVYCGLQGFISLLSVIRPQNDLGHPMCGNMRDGNWMIDYVWQRLEKDEGTKELAQWLKEAVVPLKDIPRYLVPCYFDALLTFVYRCLLKRSWSLMSRFVQDGSTFVRGLGMGSVQCCGLVKSAPLPPLSPRIFPPLPPKRKVTRKVPSEAEAERKEEEEVEEQACATLSAGLPHFSTGYMRNWGRDTFISLRGLLLLTGRHEDARYHILGYASCLRHGLIPNLLDKGTHARFNCRDAVWWWLYAIRNYVEDVPSGETILQDVVSRIFPTDDSPPIADPDSSSAKEMPLCEVMQEALNVHFQGLKFRERGAGRTIDAHMSDLGFNIEIGVNLETGFVYGGNEHNCGTWMDKMGSSEKAGNRGKPATPRDGSAIELVGLSAAVVQWLSGMNKRGLYPHNGVQRTDDCDGVRTFWTFEDWASKIRDNFEKHFWIGKKDEEFGSTINSKLVNRRCIYKDSVGASQPWADYQLRPNFSVAMAVAPELFDVSHAWKALLIADEVLRGPLGMKTLDPSDWAYRGSYDGANDSDDSSVAHGFNYHQGPEWLWPMGFFLRARLTFAQKSGLLEEGTGDLRLQKTAAAIRSLLAAHFSEVQSSPWRGLPELTNKDGGYCGGSCRTQAWSNACTLEVLYDLKSMESCRHIMLPSPPSHN
ncbi:glycogen debranching enzyme [Hetaerina americana]|uniref:glycogen debranching enzyme n=1 Tax=Hetaerina americana TaxID=62018 RepID=UPI003A7F2324